MRNFNLNGRIWMLHIVLWIFSCSLKGQETSLKQLKEEDYDLWGNLSLGNVSPDGDWISYQISYAEGYDTLYLKNISGGNIFKFEHGIDKGFYPSKWYACQTGSGLNIVDLRNKKTVFISDVHSFDFFNEGNIIAYQIKTEVYLRNLDKEANLMKIKNVSEFKFSPQKDKLVYLQMGESGHKTDLVEIKNGRIVINTLFKNERPLESITWENSGEAVAFYSGETDETSNLIYYKVADRKVYRFNPREIQGFPSMANLSSESYYPLNISVNPDRIYFGFREGNLCSDTNESKVEIWSGNAAYTYLQEQYICPLRDLKLGVWFPTENKFKRISLTEYSKVFLTGDTDYAIVYDPEQYEPQYNYYAPADFHIMNIQTGEDEFILKNHSGYPAEVMPSPKGKYIAHFFEGNWWLYNLKTKVNKNLTDGLCIKWENGINENNGDLYAYGLAGWAKEDNYLFIYDRFDIYRFDTGTGKSVRITRGSEQKIKYRLVDSGLNIINYDGYMGRKIDAGSGIILQAEAEDASTGFYRWSEESGLQELIFLAGKADQFHLGKGFFFFREQRYDLPPRIVKVQNNQPSETVIESNPQHCQYEWGKAEAISFQIPNGSELKGILYYPAGFEMGKKYPMVVKIYEKQFNRIHEYISPKKFSSIGFNITHFTQNGYFVLLPDIEYELGKVGYSATECVLAAVEKVKESGYIDKIGIIGHSFGGYETNFIISQTNLFDAAVSGAGVSDLVSFYLNLNWVTGKPDMWRFENNIWRMGKSLFEDREIYYLNSPVSFAENIDTPLLLWTGNKDYQVNWHQSVTLYLALRRLKKKQCLLIYPNESHALLIKENQADLSSKIMDWFDYHLKMEKPAEWIGK